MSVQANLDMKSLVADYLFANTVKFLYNRFRKNVSVASLIGVFAPPKLVEEFQRRTSGSERTVEDEVVAYAITVSFTFLPLEADQWLQTLDLSSLPWGASIRDIYLRSAQSNNRMAIEVSHVPSVKFAEKSSDVSPTIRTFRAPAKTVMRRLYDGEVEVNAVRPGGCHRFPVGESVCIQHLGTPETSDPAVRSAEFRSTNYRGAQQERSESVTLPDEGEP